MISSADWYIGLLVGALIACMGMAVGRWGR